MSEVTFAKSFLATLDKRPIKLPADHVSDPRKYPTQSPFILPKNNHPFPQRETPTSTQQAKETTVTATLKPMRSGVGDAVTLSDITLDSTIHDLKSSFAQKSGQPQDKIKLLLNKKPAADLKTLKELGVDGDVEFSVMVMGAAGTISGAPSPAVEKKEPPFPAAAPATDKMDIDSGAPAPESEKAQAKAQAPPSTNDAAGILRSEEFWADLKDFLSQRLRDHKGGEELAKVFREAWSKR